MLKSDDSLCMSSEFVALCGSKQNGMGVAISEKTILKVVSAGVMMCLAMVGYCLRCCVEWWHPLSCF